jgi:hypothetical protein
MKLKKKRVRREKIRKIEVIILLDSEEEESSSELA